MQRTRIAMALTLAAGAFLYLSDHDSIDRHWRLALGLSIGALIVALSALRPSGRARPLRRIAMCAVLAVSVSGCGASRSSLGVTSAVTVGLGGLMLQSAADPENQGTTGTIVPIGAGLVVVGCILGIAAAVPGDPATPPTFAKLPTPATPVHASFTPVHLPAHAGAR